MISGARWVLCAFLLAATILNYLDRQTLGILAPTIQRELRLDNEALGWLFSIFYYCYTFAQFGIGPLLDRFNMRWMYGGAALLWSAIASLTGQASSFVSFAVFRGALGVAEAPNWPAAMRIVARVLPAEERPLGNGIFTSGTSIGALIAPGLVLGISAWLGWRWSFRLVGALGIIWFGVWVLFTRAGQFRHIWRPAVPPNTEHPFRSILSRPQFWRVLAVAVLVNPCLYFFLNWLPTYLAQQRGIQSAGRLAPILTAVYLGLDAGNLTSGFAVLLLTRRGWLVRRARRLVFCAASLGLGASAFLPFIHDLTAAIAVLVAIHIAIGAWISIYLTLAQEVSPEHVSTAAGLLGGSGSLAGALAMWIVGKVTHESGTFTYPLQAVAVAGFAAAVAGWNASREPAN